MDVMRELTDVPDDQVKYVVADFQSEGAEVTTKLQANGLWTVVARFSENSNAAS